VVVGGLIEQVERLGELEALAPELVIPGIDLVDLVDLGDLVYVLHHLGRRAGGCGSSASGLDGSKNDHLTSLSLGRRGGSGYIASIA
jgi:hypothetical protein